MADPTVEGAARTVNPSESQTPEEWRRVADFTGYEVSNKGRVRRVMRARANVGKYKYRAWCFNTSGYPHVGLARGGKDHTRLVHALVAAAFIGPRPDGMQINHKNGNKKDPRVENLEYVTAAYNTQHAYATGLISHPRGEEWHASVLTNEDVRRIRSLASVGVKYKHIGDAFGISESRISEIVNGKAWQHVA